MGARFAGQFKTYQFVFTDPQEGDTFQRNFTETSPARALNAARAWASSQGFTFVSQARKQKEV